MPVVMFFSIGGEPLAAGDQLTITAKYDNTSGKLLHAGAMGIVVGYFVPQTMPRLHRYATPQNAHAPDAPRYARHERHAQHVSRSLSTQLRREL